MLKRRVLLWCLVAGIVVFCPIISVFSQTGGWTTYNVSNSSLPNNDVRAIAVEGDDVWFGTYGGGLCRFQISIDVWKIFNTSNSNILSDYVQAISNDGEAIWIGTDLGVNRYNLSTDQWTTWDSIYCVSSIAVSWEDVWFATTGSGVYQYHKSTGQWTIVDSSNSDLPSNYVTAVEVDGDFIWFGTKSGVVRYQQSTGTWQIIMASIGDLGSNSINGIEADGEYIWFVHNPGVLTDGSYKETYLNTFPETDCPPDFLLSSLNVKFPGGMNSSISRLNTVTGQWQNYEISEAGPDTLRREKNCFSVLSVAATEDEVWFGTVSKGIYRYDKQSNTFINYHTNNSNISGDMIWTIAVGRNFVWMGTYNQGISRYKIPTELWKTWRKSDGLVDEYVEDIAVYGDEAWFATRRGVSRLQISTDVWTNFSAILGNAPILFTWAIGVDENYVWVGPALYEYEKTTNIWTKLDSSVSLLGKSNVYSIKVKDDKVWFGADHGKISCYDKSADSWTLYDSSVTQFNGAIGTIDVFDDEVWFGGLGDGAGYFNTTTGNWTKFDTTNSNLADNHVTSVAIDGDLVWYSTFGGGICRYDKSIDEWIIFNADNTGIIFLDYMWAIGVYCGFVWCGSHSQGIFRYEKTTGLWDNFNTLNSPLISRRLYDIEVAGGYVWLATYDPYGNQEGSVNRYGDVSPPILLHNPIAEEQPSLNSVTILATIEDNVKVKASDIFYRSPGMTDYKTTPLAAFSVKTWHGQIPASYVNPGVIEYYLTSTDGCNTATHPYTSAINSPHRFYVYDSVPPIGHPTISSPTNYIANNIIINANISIDGTGSKPSLDKVMLFQYEDLAAENVVDSAEISLAISWEEEKDNKYSLQGSYNIGILNPNTAAIKLRITISDQGHDEFGNPLVVQILSNPLFKYTGPIASTAQITEPDSMDVVTGIVTIKGTASDDNFKQYKVSYLDFLNNWGIIQSALESKNDAVLALWDTKGLSEGEYKIILEVENFEGAIANDLVSVVLDTTHPQCQILNLDDNMVVGGNLAIFGSAADKHFAEYYLEYGGGINPAQWEAIGGLHVEPVINDTLGSWNTLGMDGYHTIRLRVIDKAGLQNSDIKILKLDNTGTRAVISAPQNQEIVTQQVEIQGTVSDENFKSYTVEYRSMFTPASWVKIFSDTLPVSNGLLANWNTDELNGQFWIRLKAEDRSGFIRMDSVKVIVDNLQPVAQITLPNERSQVGEIVSIEGTAYDENFAEYILEWGPGENPQIWTKITSTRFAATVQDDVLATWNASGKRGIYNLQLTAIDRVGYRAKDTVVVDIIDEIDAQSGGCIFSPDSLVELCLAPNAISNDILITVNREADENLVSISQVELLCPEYRISPVKQKLDKPGVLTMTYTEEMLACLTDQRKLAITRYSQSDSLWEIIGGTPESGLNKITAAIHKLGWYSLTEAKTTGEKNEITETNAQPRIFSPRGKDYTETMITFHLGKDSNITIKVFNLAGRLVRTLCDNRFMTSGSNSIAWDGKDSSGNFCVNGLYVIMIQSEKEKAAKTVMVLDK